MDYYKLANNLMSEIVKQCSDLVNLEEGDLELYLMGRPWLNIWGIGFQGLIWSSRMCECVKHIIIN